MVSASLGGKHVCTGCATRFYDLNQPVPTCPKCGMKVATVSPSRSRRKVTAEAAAATLLKKPHESHSNVDDLALPDDDSMFGSDLDTIEALEEDDESDIVSLSELDDRESSDSTAVGDDVEESQLMEDMSDYDTILDDADGFDEDDLDDDEEELRA